MKDSDEEKDGDQETQPQWSQRQIRQKQWKRNRAIGDQRVLERKYRINRRVQQRQVAFLEMELQQANKARLAAQRRILAAEEALWKKQDKLERAHYQIHDLEVEKKKTKMQLRALQDQIGQSKQLWAAKQSQHRQEAEKTKSSMKELLKKLQDEKATQNKEYNQKELHLRKLYQLKQEENAQVQRKLDQARAAAAGLQIQMQELRMEMQTHNLVMQQAKNRISHQAAQTDRFLRIIHQAQLQIKTLSDKQQKQRRARQELQNKVAILSSSQRHHQQQAAALSQQGARLRSINQSARIIQMRLHQSLHDLQQQLSTQRDEFNKKSEQAELEHRRNIMRLQNEHHDAMKKQIQLHKVTKEALNIQIKRLNELRKQGQLTTEQYSRRVQQLQYSKKQQKQSYQKTIQAIQMAYQTEITGLKRQLVALNSQIESSHIRQMKQNDTLRHQITMLQKELLQLRAAEKGRDMYQTQLQELLNQAKLAMEKSNQENQRAIHDLTQQNRRIQRSLSLSTQAEVRNAQQYERQLSIVSDNLRQRGLQISQLRLIISQMQHQNILSIQERKNMLNEIQKLKRELRDLPSAIAQDIQFKKQALKVMKKSANQIHSSVDQHHVPAPRQLSIISQPNEGWVPQQNEQIFLAFELDPSQQVDQDTQFRGSLQYGNSQLKISQKPNRQVWIGIEIKKPHRSFFTKNCIHLPKKLLKAIPGSFEQLESIKSDQKITIMITSQLAMIRDLYKQRRYYGLRMMKYYQGNPTPTKNGFNLTKKQMKRLCDYILNLR